MAIKLPNDFKELLKLFNENGVEYLLIGGYAVNFYGYIRSTGAIDFWIKPDSANAKKLVKVLNEFGFGASRLDEELFLRFENLVRMGVPPVRIELMASADGVDFDECYKRCLMADIDGCTVRVISLEDLKCNKRATGSAKDQADLEELP